MTLLELLHQELPKRGGWPEGAAKAASYSHIPGVHFWDGNGFRVDFSDLTTRTLGCEEVTREQYGWDDTNLPPVGCECECSWADVEWQPCKILFTSNQLVVVKLKESGIEDAYNIGDVTFRPLRTEAERAIDEMVRLSGVSINAAKILYDAGYRK